MSAGVVLTGVGFVVGLALGLALRIGDRRGGKGAHVVLGALKGEHVALYKEATPARTAVPLEQPIVVNGVGWTTREVGTGFRWTTYGRTIHAAVTVPDTYRNGAEIIVPLAGPVDEALPVDPAVPPIVPPSSGGAS